MRQIDVEQALREHVEAIEQLQPDPRRVRAALVGPAEKRSSRRRVPLVSGLACLVLGTAVASAASGLLDPALDSFLGGGDSPGRQLPSSELPVWLRPGPGYNAPGEVTVVAAAGKERLYAYRQRGAICFDYGHHMGECRSPRAWRRHLEEARWVLRGPLGRSVWFGLADAAIVSVRGEYSTGEATEVAVRDGGFVIDLRRDRDPGRLVGLDASGDEVVSRPLAAGGP